MKKKNIGIWAITLIIAGLMIAVSATAMVQKPNEEKRYINWDRAEARISGVEMTEIMPAKELKHTPGQLSADPLYNGAYPDVASGGSNICLGFDAIEDPGTWFTFSQDGGASWHESAYGWDVGESMWPSVDFSAGNRFYGTISPDWSTNGYVTQCDFVDITDPETWVAGTWDWSSHDIMEFEGLSMAAMDDSLEEWRWGYITMSGYNGYSTPTADGCPYVMYATDDGYATISWLIDGDTGDTLGGCENAASEIDPVRYYNYAIWERYNDAEGTYNLEFRKDDSAATAGESGFVTAGELVTSENNRYPDVSAYDNNVIIVSEADGDIVCYYSNNGLNNFDASFVASTTDDETFPRITHTGEDEAICTFIKNENIYYSMTDNGGATWDEPTMINDVDGQVSEEYLSSGVCELGACFGGNDDIVYYGAVGAKPLITIEGFSGGFGATATIKNVGTADATNVECSITVTGGFLGMVNKTVPDTISSIAVNEEVTISTGIFLGLGSIEITATADSASETVEGTQILVYTMI
jgi:hypothetical protein